MSDSAWSSFNAFIRDEVIMDPSLIIPVRFLWQAYIQYCELWGFSTCSPAEFISYILTEENVEIRQGGRGRIRRMIVGMSLKIQETEDGCNAGFGNNRNQT